MKLYLDSADLDEITRVAKTNAISGVTTNPSLVSKTRKGNYFERLNDIAEILSGACNKRKHLSVEVITLDPHEMVDQAIDIWSNLKTFNNLDVHVKIPLTLDTLGTITTLETKYNIRVNATACMVSSQAKLAMDAGASVVSFFYNRMKDGGNAAPFDEIKEFSDSRDVALDADWYSYNKNGNPAIICGSIRRPSDVYECWNAGADAVTASMKIIELLSKHPQTDKAIKGFQNDIEEWLK